MILIENTDIYGWGAALRGMRNPMNSWDKADTKIENVYLQGNINRYLTLGEQDLKLAKQLAVAGTDHGKFLRMITVTADIVAPLYWWKEYDTYKVGTVANSCSTMHKIADKPFCLDDFSSEHLLTDAESDKYDCDASCSPLEGLARTIDLLNKARNRFLETHDKVFWWQMIQLLPSSYNQRRTVQLNYAVLRNIYQARRNHKLDEWRDFCKWIKRLPHDELITG